MAVERTFGSAAESDQYQGAMGARSAEQHAQKQEHAIGSTAARNMTAGVEYSITRPSSNLL